ncbi:hypothetical protein DFS34DRAFT_611805 [Phlyctochytrium arcticum]|nr:hypothetical protein DFS34DRAFT_611805 [Phlyctochytrium arcticum]
MIHTRSYTLRNPPIEAPEKDSDEEEDVDSDDSDILEPQRSTPEPQKLNKEGNVKKISKAKAQPTRVELVEVDAQDSEDEEEGDEDDGPDDCCLFDLIPTDSEADARELAEIQAEMMEDTEDSDELDEQEKWFRNLPDSVIEEARAQAEDDMLMYQEGTYYDYYYPDGGY